MSSCRFCRDIGRGEDLFTQCFKPVEEQSVRKPLLCKLLKFHSMYTQCTPMSACEQQNMSLCAMIVRSVTAQAHTYRESCEKKLVRSRQKLTLPCLQEVQSAHTSSSSKKCHSPSLWYIQSFPRYLHPTYVGYTSTLTFCISIYKKQIFNFNTPWLNWATLKNRTPYTPTNVPFHGHSLARKLIHTTLSYTGNHAAC